MSTNLRQFTMETAVLEGVLKKKRESLSGLKRARWLMCDQLREVWGSLKYKEIHTWDSHPRSGSETSQAISGRSLSSIKRAATVNALFNRQCLHYASMEKSLATPEQPQSSVFMTPTTSSSIKPFSLHPRPRVLTPVPFSLLSPAATPGGSSMELPFPPEHEDILSELYERGMPLVSQQILAYLDPAELCRLVELTLPSPWISCDSYIR